MSELTLKEKLGKYFEEKIAGGYKILDKDAAVRLKKMAMQDLQIKKGNLPHVTDQLRNTMEKLQIKLPDTLAKGDFVGGIRMKVLKTETMPPATPVNPQPIPQNSTGAIGSGAIIEPPAQDKIVTPAMAESYGKGLKHLFGNLMKFYAKIGAIEVEDVKTKDEPMRMSDYLKETDQLADSWADYCLTHNIRLPKIFEFLMLCVTSFAVLAFPMISMMLNGRKKKEKINKENLGRGGDDAPTRNIDEVNQN